MKNRLNSDSLKTKLNCIKKSVPEIYVLMTILVKLLLSLL